MTENNNSDKSKSPIYRLGSPDPVAFVSNCLISPEGSRLMTKKNFRPYPEPEDYEAFEDYLEDLYSNDENSEETYQEIEDEIIGEELEGYWEETGSINWDKFCAPLKRFPDYSFSYIPNCCRTCPNHISNGGSGVCLCTLPYFEQQTSQYITYSTETTGQIELNGNVIITGSLEVS